MKEMKKGTKAFLVLAGIILLVALVFSTKRPDDSGDVTLFCERKLVGVPEWLDVSEPEGGLAPGATASGLLAVRAREYLREHEEIETFEIKEVVLGKEKPFLKYENFYLESADNGGARMSLSQALLDDNVAETARNIKRSRGHEKEAEVIYASLANRDAFTYAWRHSFTRGQKNAKHFAPMTDEYWSAWTKDGVMMQANYGDFVYIAGREDPVCITATGIAKVEDGASDLFTLSKSISETSESSYAVYGDGLVARENPRTGQLEVCEWYADKIEWAGNDYYPKLFNRNGYTEFVFVPNERIASKTFKGAYEIEYGQRSVMAKYDGFALVEYDDFHREWYTRCQVTGTGFAIPIYGNDDFNLVATEVGVFVVSPTQISLIKGVSVVKTEHAVTVYDGTKTKQITKSWLNKLSATNEICNEIQSGSLLGHKAKSLLRFDEYDPTDLSYSATSVDVYAVRNDEMNSKYINELHGVVEIKVEDIDIKWSTLEYY